MYNGSIYLIWTWFLKNFFLCNVYVYIYVYICTVICIYDYQSKIKYKLIFYYNDRIYISITMIEYIYFYNIKYITKKLKKLGSL